MAKKYLDYDGLLYFWQKIKTLFVPVTRTVNSKALSADISLTASDVGAAPTSHKSTATTYGVGDSSNYGHLKLSDSITSTTSTSGGTAATPKAVKAALDAAKDYVDGDTLIYNKVNTDGTVLVWNYDDDRSFNFLEGTALQAKIDGIAAGAEVNQNAFSNVKVGSTTVVADTKTDTLELVAGSNVTLTPDATNDKVTIAATDTTYPAATTAVAGLMSSADKAKIDGIANGAEVNQNAFSKIAVGGSSIIEADSAEDTVKIVPGSNISLTANTSEDKITIAADYKVGTAELIEAGTNTLDRVWSSKILHDYVTGQIETAVTGATAYQGIAPTSFAPTNYKAGWYWIIGTAGTYVGQVCEAGDMIFCKTAAATYSADNFDVVQTNLDITSITNAEIDTILAA